MRGYNVPIGTTESFLGPKAGVYAQSPLSQIAGSASLVGALFGKQGKEGTGQSIAGDAYDWLRGAWKEYTQDDGSNNYVYRGDVNRGFGGYHDPVYGDTYIPDPESPYYYDTGVIDTDYDLYDN